MQSLDLNRFGLRGMQHLKIHNPALFQKLEEEGLLDVFLRHCQDRAEWDFHQLTFGGLDEDDAEAYVLREYFQF